MTGQHNEIPEGGSMTVTASVAEDVGNVTYVWYINGDAVGTGDTYTVSGLDIGVYRLDVTAFTADGRRAGSATHGFYVIETQDNWTILLGSTESEYGYSIATDINENIFVAGETDGDLDGIISKGERDAFVAKYDNNGNKLWCNLLGSINYDSNTGIDTDQDGNCYVVGYTQGDLGIGGIQRDAFITKYDSNGIMLWITEFISH